MVKLTACDVSVSAPPIP